MPEVMMPNALTITSFSDQPQRRPDKTDPRDDVTSNQPRTKADGRATTLAQDQSRHHEIGERTQRVTSSAVCRRGFNRTIVTVVGIASDMPSPDAPDPPVNACCSRRNSAQPRGVRNCNFTTFWHGRRPSNRGNHPAAVDIQRCRW
mgnify:CR=1 FL=1